MASPGGFWSYVHADDDAENKRITRLAKDVGAQYEMITGDAIDLFLDREKLNWGDDWKSRIDDNLSTVAFFIPILTPRYFLSKECRRELSFFANRATELGIRELVLPILYVDVPTLTLKDDSNSDPLIDLTGTFNWVRWTELRFADPGSSEYRSAVAGLASRLAQAIATTESAEPVVLPGRKQESPEEDTPGFWDLVAGSETAMPEWAETVTALGEQMTAVGELTQRASEELQAANERGEGATARLVVFARLAEELAEPSIAVEALAGRFSSLLLDIDSGMNAILDRIPEELENRTTKPEEVETFFSGIRMLTGSSEEGLGALEKLVALMQPVESGSRNLRPVMRRLRKALTIVAEGRDVMRAWAHRIEEIDGPRNTAA